MSSSKGKIKATSGSLNKKALVTLDETTSNALCNIINTTIFQDFISEGANDARSKTSEYIVVMERIINDDSDNSDNELSKTNVPDKLTNPNDWEYPDNTPRIYKRIIKFCKNKYKIPAESRIKIFIGKYMRLSGTKIDPPTPDTINRIIINLNNTDIYRLEPGPILSNEILNKIKDLEKKINDDNDPAIDKSYNDMTEMLNKPLEPKTLLLESGKCLPMGPIRQSNYIITLNSGKEIRIPPKIDGHLPISGNNKRITLKPRSYSRITIVVDIMVTSDMVAKITEETIKTMSENTENINKIRNDIMNNNISMESLVNDDDSSVKKPRRRRKNKK